MNIIRLFSFLTIFGLLFVSTTVVFGSEDPVDNDVEVDEEEQEQEQEPVLRSDETITPANDILEGKEDEDPNRIPSSPDFHTVYIFIQPAKANGLIAGKLTRLLVGTRKNGTQNFIVE
ncbi:unnamed protein product, partial [Rotaria sp. Silwood1]